jgi:putative ABC transport system ATP-binding protein
MPESSQTFNALDLPCLDAEGGDRLALAGPSGSGKTTLLNIIAGLLTPTTGTVHVNGEEITAMGERQRDRFRAANVGIVFQSFNLLPAFNAVENVTIAMDLAARIPSKQRREAAENLLLSLGLESRLRHKPGQLSVGEQQRVAVARALANSPSIILADEPTASVDPRTREVVMERLFEANRTTGAILIVATHDQSLHSLFDRVIKLEMTPASAIGASR